MEVIIALGNGSLAVDMGDSSSIIQALTGFSFVDLKDKKRISFATVDIGAYESILKCNTDTLYVKCQRTVPSLPLDSIIDTPIDPKCQLLVNGVVTTTDIPFDCSKLGQMI